MNNNWGRKQTFLPHQEIKCSIHSLKSNKSTILGSQCLQTSKVGPLYQTCLMITPPKANSKCKSISIYSTITICILFKYICRICITLKCHFTIANVLYGPCINWPLSIKANMQQTDTLIYLVYVSLSSIKCTHED